MLSQFGGGPLINALGCGHIHDDPRGIAPLQQIEGEHRAIVGFACQYQNRVRFFGFIDHQKAACARHEGGEQSEQS